LHEHPADRLPPHGPHRALHLHGHVGVLGRAVPAGLLLRGAAPASLRDVIALDGPALAPAEAARRAARGQGAFWLSGPAADEVTIAVDAVGADPVRFVRGGSVAELEHAWAEERARWAATGAAPGPGVPIAAGWLAYDLGRPWMGLSARVPDAAV